MELFSLSDMKLKQDFYLLIHFSVKISGYFKMDILWKKR